jgi:4-hydroxyphenylpyruvate dioxygenase
MGTDGFEFVEHIGAPTRRPWRACSNAYGSPVRHRSKNVSLYKQRGIIFIVNARPERFTQAFERMVVC